MRHILLVCVALSCSWLAACSRTAVNVGNLAPDSGIPLGNGGAAGLVEDGAAGTVEPDTGLGGQAGPAGNDGAPGAGGVIANDVAPGAGGAISNDALSGSGGAIGAGGVTGNGGAPGVGGITSGTGGGIGNGGGPGTDAGTTGTGDAPGTGGTTGTGGSAVLPCDVLKNAGNQVVAAHSTVRVIVSGYAGPLYQVCKGTASAGPSSCKGTTQDVGSADGYANVATQDAFCADGSCFITKIYDQSGKGNDLEPAPGGGARRNPDLPANAEAVRISIGSHSAYGLLIKAGMGYRAGCTGCNTTQGYGMAKGDEPQTIYMVTSQKDLVDSCCFDYGNAETTCNDDGNGTMEAVNFSAGVVWGTGYGGKPGPWVMADLGNGLYAGWEDRQMMDISTNKPIKFDFVTAVLLGDTGDKNAGKGRFALLGGDATAGKLQFMYDGIRPEKSGFVPMKKQGSIVLGIGGDNSADGGGRFYEGAVAIGPVATKETLDALQAAIVAARYGK